MRNYNEQTGCRQQKIDLQIRANKKKPDKIANSSKFQTLNILDPL